MNIYYLKRFRKKAKQRVYLRCKDAFFGRLTIYELKNSPFNEFERLELGSYHYLEDALRDLNSYRRAYVFHLVDEKRLEKKNKEYAKL